MMSASDHRSRDPLIFGAICLSALALIGVLWLLARDSESAGVSGSITWVELPDYTADEVCQNWVGYWLNESGVEFTPEFMERKKNTLKDVYQLADLIREDELLMAMIEQIHVSNRGEITLVAKVGPAKVLFGQMTDAEEKLRRLKIFYQEVTSIEGWQKYRAVDLRYKGQVVGVK